VGIGSTTTISEGKNGWMTRTGGEVSLGSLAGNVKEWRGGRGVRDKKKRNKRVVGKGDLEVKGWVEGGEREWWRGGKTCGDHVACRKHG